MSIWGYNPSTRLAQLVTEAHEIAKASPPSTATPSVPTANGHAPSKTTLEAILSDAKTVANGLNPYIELCSSVPDSNAQVTKTIQEMLDANYTTDWAGLLASGQTKFILLPEMTSNLYEAGVFSFFCSLLRPRRVLEVGMFTGTSTVAFAAAKSVENVVALEIEPYLEAWCRPFWKKAGQGLNEKIDVRIGPAKDSLEKIIRDGEAPFDLIFIDADKESYSTYFRQIIDNKLLSPNGMIMIDNVLFKGGPYAPFPSPLLSPPDADQNVAEYINKMGKTLHDTNLEIAAHPDVEVVMLPIRDGISLVKWKTA